MHFYKSPQGASGIGWSPSLASDIVGGGAFCLLVLTELPPLFLVDRPEVLDALSRTTGSSESSSGGGEKDQTWKSTISKQVQMKHYGLVCEIV
jgi:hypothetical protein